MWHISIISSIYLVYNHIIWYILQISVLCGIYLAYIQNPYYLAYICIFWNISNVSVLSGIIYCSCSDPQKERRGESQRKILFSNFVQLSAPKLWQNNSGHTFARDIILIWSLFILMVVAFVILLTLLLLIAIGNSLSIIADTNDKRERWLGPPWKLDAFML